MLYMLQVYLLVAVPIFALAGAVLLSLKVWAEAKHYITEARRRAS